jgi:hypothetical protein
MDELNKYFKDHTDKRITEMRERVRNLKAEKVKEKIRKISEKHMKKRERVERKN